MRTHPLRVALIQPAVPAGGLFERLGRSDLPPLGLLYLGAALRRAGHRVRVFDLNTVGSLSAMVSHMIHHRPHVVGIGTLAPSLPDVNDLADRLRDRLPASSRIVVGGADATARPLEYTGSGLFDAVLVGEAEQTLVDLCAAWPEVPALPGVIPRGQHTCERATAVEPDRVPFPDRDLLPPRRYRGGPAYKRGHHTVSVFTHRGCPYHCTFCEQAVHTGPVRYRSAESVLEEVRQVRREFGIHDIRFVDDVMMARRSVMEEFAEAILLSGERFAWMCTGRVDLVDGALLRLMRRAGCYRIEYGIESGVDRVLELVRKGFDGRQVRRALDATRQAGIESIANFILGFPTETEAEMVATVDRALQLDPDYAVFFPFCPFPGSPMARQFALGWDPDQPAFRAPSPAYCVSNRRLMQLVETAYGRFYFRPRTVLRRALAIRSGWICADLAGMGAAYLGRQLAGSLRARDAAARGRWRTG